MVDVGTSFAAGFLATFIPLYIGMFTPGVLPRIWKNPKILTALAAFSAGIIFWFFLDVMGDAVLLDVNQGVSANVTLANRETQAVLVILFAVGLGILFVLERKSSTPSASVKPAPAPANSSSQHFAEFTFAIAAVSALAIGFHALGEGMDIGSSIPSSPSIIEAIGSLYAGVAYILHKFLEGFVIGVFALLASSAFARKLGLLGLISGVPTMIGFFLGAYNPFPIAADTLNPLNIAFFFALGGAGAIYIETKLIPLIARNGMRYSTAIALLLGFYTMYIAGLFHG